MALLKLSLIAGSIFAIGAAMLADMGSVSPPNIPPGSPTGLIPPWFAFKIGCKLHEIFSFLAFVTQPPDAYIIDLSTAYWRTEVTYTLAYHKIFDAVQAENSASCEKVAESLELQAFVVCRYMEAGKNLNLFAKDASTKEYSLTPHGALLTETGGFRDFLLTINGETKGAWRAVTTDLIKTGGGETGKSGFELHTGLNAWEFFGENPEKEAEFGRAMLSLNPGPTGALLVDWKPPSEDAVVCDVGGGIGSLIGEVLLHYPKMKGIVFDQPKVAERAKTHMASLGVTDRTEAVGGSFFEAFPAELSECDVFFMRYIIHDWPDEENVEILKNIRDVASKTEKKKVVVVMDQILDTGAPSFLETSKSLMSINMISSCKYGARERSVPELTELFQAAGYDKLELDGDTDTKFIPLRTIHSVLQVEI